MKKLFILMTVAALAFVGQAMQLDWQYTGVSTDVGKTVYVMLGAAAQTEWESLSAVQEAAVSSGTVAKSGRSNYWGTGSFSSDNINKTTANVYYVIVSADKSTFDVTSVANMAGSVYDPNNQESSTGANTALSSASITSSGNSFGGGGGGDIPEPTSGLLLLVGAGMLALRRKQK